MSNWVFSLAKYNSDSNLVPGSCKWVSQELNEGYNQVYSDLQDFNKHINSNFEWLELEVNKIIVSSHKDHFELSSTENHSNHHCKNVTAAIPQHIPIEVEFGRGHTFDESLESIKLETVKTMYEAIKSEEKRCESQFSNLIGKKCLKKVSGKLINSVKKSTIEPKNVAGINENILNAIKVETVLHDSFKLAEVEVESSISSREVKSDKVFETQSKISPQELKAKKQYQTEKLDLSVVALNDCQKTVGPLRTNSASGVSKIPIRKSKTRDRHKKYSLANLSNIKSATAFTKDSHIDENNLLGLAKRASRLKTRKLTPVPNACSRFLPISNPTLNSTNVGKNSSGKLKSIFEKTKTKQEVSKQEFSWEKTIILKNTLAKQQLLNTELMFGNIPPVNLQMIFGYGSSTN